MSTQAPARPAVDGQIVEVRGRARLTIELAEAGFEIARPERDDGVDLIVYRRQPFRAVPIQLKVSTGPRFGIARRYEGLVLVFVWLAAGATYVVPYDEALRIAEEWKWTETVSWRDKGGYNTGLRLGGDLHRRLENFRSRWEGLL